LQNPNTLIKLLDPSPVRLLDPHEVLIKLIGYGELFGFISFSPEQNAFDSEFLRNIEKAQKTLSKTLGDSVLLCGYGPLPSPLGTLLRIGR